MDAGDIPRGRRNGSDSGSLMLVCVVIVVVFGWVISFGVLFSCWLLSVCVVLEEVCGRKNTEYDFKLLVVSSKK